MNLIKHSFFSFYILHSTCYILLATCCLKYVIINLYMNRLKKFVLSFLSFMVIFASSASYLPSVVQAQDTNPWYVQTYSQWFTKVYDQNTSPPQEIFGERYTAAQVQWVIYSLMSLVPSIAGETISCIFKGGGVDNCIYENPFEAYGSETKPFEEKGFLAILFDARRSPSGVNYIRSKVENLGVIPQAEAQTGFGFSALNPIQKIWRVCRDIMYGFFVIIIIVFAFMIMFRVKLNPQTVVSVQSSIPKIIISLILVTFSYAIAGLLIDLMYVVIGLVALIFTTFGLFGTVGWSKIFSLLTVGPGSEYSVGGIVGWMVGYWWPFVVAFFGSCASLFGLGAGGVALGILGMVIGVLIAIGVILWLIVATLKLFILVIKTYLMILVSIIFSPFIIGFGAILPTGGFMSWVKGLVSNLMVYPLIGALMLLSVMFLTATFPQVKTSVENWLDVPEGSMVDIFSPDENTQFWYPPMTLGEQNQEKGWDPLPILWTFASLGIVAMVPNVANMLKSLMAGKGIEGSDLLGKGGPLSWGVGTSAALGALAAKGVGGWAGRGFTERVVVKRAERVAKGEPSSGFDRWISGVWARRGWLQPYDARPEVLKDTQIRPKGAYGRRGLAPRTTSQQESPPGTPPPPSNFPDDWK